MKLKRLFFLILGCICLGFGFFMMWRKELTVPCVILAIVWVCHMVYFLFGVKTIRQPKKSESTKIHIGERREST